MRKFLLYLALYIISFSVQAQVPVWNSAVAFDFQSYFNINVPQNEVDWYVVDHKGNEFKVPQTQESSYYFNRDGRDEWGKIHIRPVYICQNTGSEVPFNPATVELEVLDYGLYSLSDFGQQEKFYPSSIDPGGTKHFDPTLPTVVYVHGFAPNSVKDHERELLLNKSTVSMAKKWRGEGWNVLVFYWNQISDANFPIGVLNAEAKIRSGDFTWRKEDGSINKDEASAAESVAELLAAELNSLDSELSAGVEMRLAGHSLGGQLVVAAASLTNSAPDRLAPM